MADRYISREWLLKTLDDYKNLNTWNTEVCDADTILRVLQVIENVVNGAPDIGPRQYRTKQLAAKNAALKFELYVTDKRIDEHKNSYRRHESANNILSMGFYKGMICAEEDKRRWLEGMVRDG